MEKEKWSYLDYILKLNCDISLYDYLTEIRKIANQARQCYSDDTKMNDEEFLQMLLLDGCFILTALGGTKELLQWRQQASSKVTDNHSSTAEHGHEQMTPDSEQVQDEGIQTSKDGNNQKDDDVERSQYDDVIGQWFIRFFNHDLILLENQIPFFVVRKIFELVAGQHSMIMFTDEIAKHIEAALRWYPKAIKESDRPKDFCYLLHLCQLYLKPAKKLEQSDQCQVGPQYINRFLSFGRKYLRIRHQPDDNDSVNDENECIQGDQALNRWRRAAQYLEAGVKFKKREYDKLDPHGLLDIKFSDGVLEIPCLVTDEYTGTLFRNLIAFEQTCPQFGDDITAYIVFLSQLISMPEDVTLLGQREIVIHHLDDDEKVSDLFTMLSKDVVFDFNGSYYLKSLCQTMESHYQSRMNRWMAWLWLNHFSNPWLALAAFSTVIVLVCTVVQTVYGILAYVKPPE